MAAYNATIRANSRESEGRIEITGWDERFDEFRTRNTELELLEYVVSRVSDAESHKCRE